MLSTKPIKQAAHARFYFYEKDNYYFKDSLQAQEHSQWMGRGTESLHLSGQVDPIDFESLLQGKLPNGVQLGKVNNGKITHRPGYDLTFSAPKSVSLLALIGKDQRLIDAHTRAVEKTLQRVERLCAQARVTQDGVVHFEDTHNLVFATFLQDLSRSMDPHLHTHCVTMNATLRKNGLWRSLASQFGLDPKVSGVNGFWERVRTYQRYIGLLYRSELAYEVTQLGYNIDKRQHGFWEIRGVDAQDVAFFSKRRQDIEAFLAERGLSGAKASAYATLATRQNKQSMDRKILLERWQGLAKTNFQAVIELAAQPKSAVIKSPPTQIAINAMHQAIHLLSEQQSMMTECELVNTVLTDITTELSVESIFTALKKLQQEQVLIPVNNNTGQWQFTTRELIRVEQEVLSSVIAGKKSCGPIVPAHQLSTYFLQHDSTDQHNAKTVALLRTLLRSRDRVIGLEISHSTDKKSLYQTLNQLVRLGDYKLLGLGVNTQQAKALQKSGFTRTETVLGFIYRLQEKAKRYHRIDGRNVVAVIQDAEKLSLQNWHKLMQLSEQAQCRLLPVFDRKAVLSMGVGSPIQQWITQGQLTVVSLPEKTLPHSTLAENASRNSSENTLASHVKHLIKKIQDDLVVITDQQTCFKTMAMQYVNRSSQKRQHTQLVMPTKAMAIQVNQLVHKELKTNRVLSNKPSDRVLAMVLLPVYLSQTQRQLAKHYRPGQWIQFNNTYSSLGVKKGDYVMIKAVNPKRNCVRIQSLKKKQVVDWYPDRVAGKIPNAMQVFTETVREICVGEKLLILRNQSQNKLINGDQVRVSAIKNNRLMVIREVTAGKSKKIALNLDEFAHCHFDYGYAISAFRQLDLSEHAVIAYQSAKTRLTSQRQFYQLMGCTKKTITLYTDDKTAYLNRLERHSGDRTPILEAVLSSSKQRVPKASVPEFFQHTDHLQKTIQQSISQLLVAYYGKMSSTLATRTYRLSGESTSNNTAETTLHALAWDAVQYAIAHCAEREAGFTQDQLMEMALQHVLGDCPPSAIRQMLCVAKQQGLLLSKQSTSPNQYWTTPRAMAQEQMIVDWAKASQQSQPAMASDNDVKAFLQQANVSDEQARAIVQLVTSTDRLLLIQGAPGTGKTTLLQLMQHVVRKLGYQIHYVAPTHSAVRELNKANCQAITLQQFLVNSQQNSQTHSTHQPTIFIVDESSFMSNRQLRDFLRAIDRLPSRVVLVGDRKQISAIEAGKPTTVLERVGVNTIRLEDIKRQQTPHLLSAVKSAYRGEVQACFQLLEANLLEDSQLQTNDEVMQLARSIRETLGEKMEGQLTGWELRIAAVYQTYFKTLDHTQQAPLVMTLTNANRRAINQWIRVGLQQRGVLTGQAVNAAIFEPEHFTKVEQSRVSSFQPKQWIRFNVSPGNNLIKSGEYWQVSRIDTDHQIIVLVNRQDKTAIWRPKLYQEGRSSGIEVYQKTTRSLCVGDQLRWTRSDKKRGRVGGEFITVTSIEGSYVKLITENNQPCRLDLSEQSDRHWDYAYTATTYFAQGKTNPSPIALLESYQMQLANQSNFLVMISRAVNNLTIITDDREQLLKQLLQHTGEKNSALEIVDQIQQPTLQSELSSGYKQATRPLQKLQKTVEKSSQQLDYLANPEHQRQSSLRKSHSVFWQYEFLSQKLSENITTVLEPLLGKPKKQQADQYCYGRHTGSLHVTVSGDKRGWWKDFQTDEGGKSLLSLIQREIGLGFKETLGHAANLLGLTEHDQQAQLDTSIMNKQHPSSNSATKTGWTTHQQKMITVARAIARGTKPIENTVVEEYLRETRQITGSLPTTLRYHPNVYIQRYRKTFPAMVVTLLDQKKRVQSVHLTLLDNKTHQKAAVDDPKLKFGPTPEAVGIIMNQNSINRSVSLVAEGLETAMSLASALPHIDVKSMLDKQNFKRIDLQQTHQHIVLCLDNDLVDWKRDKVISSAIQRLQQADKTVWVAMPESINQKKTDFNDLLQHAGVTVIQKTLYQAQCYRMEGDEFSSNLIIKQPLSQLLALPTINSVKDSQVTIPLASMDALIKHRDQAIIIDYLHAKSTQQIALLNHYKELLPPITKPLLTPSIEHE